mgnify:CR=1 FL=1
MVVVTIGKVNIRGGRNATPFYLIPLPITTSLLRSSMLVASGSLFVFSMNIVLAIDRTLVGSAL